MLSGLTVRLLVQAAVTALFALLHPGGWVVPTLVVAAGAVFVALAMRPEPQWRLVVTGYVALSIAFGLVGLVSGHDVPGTIVAVITLVGLLDGSGAAAFAGVPTQLPLPVQPTLTTYAAPVPQPVAAAYPPPPPPPARAAAPPVPRSAAMTVLPGR